MRTKLAACCIALAWAVQVDAKVSKAVNIDDVGFVGGLADGATKSLSKDGLKEYVPRYKADKAIPSEAGQYYGEGMTLPIQFGNEKINKCATEEAHQDLYLRQECEAINLIAKENTMRPKVSLQSNEKLVQGTRAIAANPAATLQKYNWTYPVNPDGSIGNVPQTACADKNISKTRIVKQEKRCSQYHGVEAFLCEASLNVKVDPNWNYACKEREYTKAEYQCSKKQIVECESVQSCMAKMVLLGQPQKGMKLEMQPHGTDGTHKITFGNDPGYPFYGPGETGSMFKHFIREGDNYLTAWEVKHAEFNRNMSVHIINKDQLREFKLSNIHYRNWLTVLVNGHIVYSSFHKPDDYDYDEESYDDEEAHEYSSLKFRRYTQGIIFKDVHYDLVDEITGRTLIHSVTDSSDGYSGRARYGWSSRTLNIDLLPYLQEGGNTISVRTLSLWNGGSTVDFLLKGNCSASCKERWQDDCTPYQERISK